MRRVMCEISYDGQNFSGYQKQPNARTVQGVLEAALKKMHKGQEIDIHGSGRTDASVHAIGQVFHFDTPLAIPNERWPRAFESILPRDVVVTKAQEVSPDFHARYSAVQKEYRYRVLRSAKPDVFRRHFTYHYSFPLDYGAMDTAASFLRGTHDFSSFCSTKSTVRNKVRTLHKLSFIEKNDELEFRFIGDGFLYNMVRILVGTLLEVGKGKRKPEDVITMLAAKNRKAAGLAAPGHGLFLWKVYYDN